MLSPANVEIINRDILDRGFAGAVFDFDGTISLLREQWPAVMSRLMVEQISGPAGPTAQIRQDVARYVRESAGLATITQMRHLVTLVKKYGRVSPGRILTAEAYKEIYDRRLSRLVDQKLAQLASGHLARAELLVPGVVQWLDLLAGQGTVLYIASTTDLRFLRREASALQVDHYFQEIYGPDPALPDYSKDWLVGQVIDRHNLAPNQLLVVGDGQVEISVDKKYGGFALGVASTEQPSGQVNRQKRALLLKAGADAIVPDFSNINGFLTGR